MNDKEKEDGKRMNEQEEIIRADICSAIRNGLMEMMINSAKEQMSSISVPTANFKIRIKAEFRGEKFCFEMHRPVIFDELQMHLNSRCNFKLNIYYTLRNHELIVPIRNQLELDRAIELVDFDRTSHQRSLRLLLSRYQSDTRLSTLFTCSPIPDASGTFSVQSSKIIEIPYCECRSSGTSTNTGLINSPRQNGSSVSSGVVLADFDEYCQKDTSTPCAPTNWKQGKCIGSGAFGKVYVCVDVDTGKEVALKRFNICRNDKHLKNHINQLENEINLLSTIQHNRIVQYLGAQQIDESICIFIEYMTGGSVKDYIATYGCLSNTVAGKYTYQILHGLEYLHRNEIIHRDIKPANILRDSNGNVKIGDFGSAKRLQAICCQQTSPFIGTPNYMAPEVVLGHTRHGRKADIWSVGCTLVEMLTAKPPWNNLEPMAIIFNIAKHNPTYQLPIEVDPILSYLISITFERNVDKRPSALQLLNNFDFNKFLNTS
ncbi:Protein kinase domain containing protein [Brugia malayi]|uniref:Bm5676 n=1 Tax=Brugia malayi TaxID=6279 RepID=A0A0H5S590_BRUMA|nr:Protein kinase domain containing protein [Brugia malayi]CRZ23784.1 Bm5676 [Brugia malayi]VIO95238.1 Protein kinase domain containing protein [Brugia malayi]